MTAHLYDIKLPLFLSQWQTVQRSNVSRGNAGSTMYKNVKFLSQPTSTPHPLANEEKFTPAPKKFISLTWEQNFLSEVGEKAVLKCKKK